MSIPLSFAAAIVVAWLWPEPEAPFVEVERRVHVGSDVHTAPDTHEAATIAR